MRDIQISIYKRVGVDSDNEFAYVSSNDLNGDGNDLANFYAFTSLTLNYSILTSSVTSTLVMSMSKPLNSWNALRSGQYIQIWDNSNTIFQGVLLSCQYQLMPTDNGSGGLFFIATLAPSIYQLTLAPLIFNAKQAEQLKQVTGVDVAAILAGQVAQKINATTLLDYVVKNTDYGSFFNQTILSNDLPEDVFIMATSGQVKDTMLRQSIDYANCVMYQQETGEIVIRQLDVSLEAPIELDLDNDFTNFNYTNDQAKKIVPVLLYQYTDNAYSTPCVVSNYAMLTPDLANIAKTDTLVITSAPSSEYYPRLEQLQRSGWFTGQIGQTEINNNVVSDPTTAKVFDEYNKNYKAYQKQATTNNAKSPLITAYQSLLTAKELASSIVNYATLSATISLDNKNIPDDINTLLGSIITIQNCDLDCGVVATIAREYSLMGSYMTMNIAPMGSYTGFWKNT